MKLDEAFRIVSEVNYPETVSRKEFEELKMAARRLFKHLLLPAYRRDDLRMAILPYDGGEVCPRCGGALQYLTIAGIRRLFCIACGDYPVILC